MLLLLRVECVGPDTCHAYGKAHTHTRTYKAVLIKGARGLLISKTVFMDFNEARSGAGRNRIGAGIGIHPLEAN